MCSIARTVNMPRATLAHYPPALTPNAPTGYELGLRRLLSPTRALGSGKLSGMRQKARESAAKPKATKPKATKPEAAVSPQEQQSSEDALRESLLVAQAKHRQEQNSSLVVILCGPAASGKSEVANLLCEWMDARYVRTVGFDPDASAGSSLRSLYGSLPAKGKAAIFFAGPYAAPMRERFPLRDKGSRISRESFRDRLGGIAAMESMLVRNGVRIVKLWLDLGKKDQKKRLAKLAAKNETAWQVRKSDWQENARADDFADLRDDIFKVTSTSDCPWHVVAATDPNARNQQAALAVVQALTEPQEFAPLTLPRKDEKGARAPNLSAMNRDVRLGKDSYEEKIARAQGRLSKLSRHPKFEKKGYVIALEGMDAAGKGGAIRRMTAALDARTYRLVPVAAPNEEERSYPYLWRFARHLPAPGLMTIFDRTWYGRVLVERIEGFAAKEEWERAYGEINKFEQQLVDTDTVLCKFWLAITKEEQMARFKERQEIAFKRYKITEEDLRNRKKWDAYESAAQEMIERTSSAKAPWKVVAANDKHHARLTILSAVCDRIEESL
jgi:AMP-polyphosphate phosphotransferase